MNSKEFMDAEVLQGAFRKALESEQLLEPLLRSYSRMVGEEQSGREAPHETWANIVSNASWVVSAGTRESLTLDLQGPHKTMHCYSIRWDFHDCRPQQLSFPEIGRALIAAYERVKETHNNNGTTPCLAPVPVVVGYP